MGTYKFKQNLISRANLTGEVVEKCHFRDSPALESLNLKSSLNLLFPLLNFLHLRLQI
jgi:hypothetical protein